MTLCLSLLLCLLCLAVSSAHATIYYLKPSTGLDTNNGTSTSTPWKTFTKAKGKTCGGGSTACLLPGDTLRLMGGTYDPTQYKGVSGMVKWTQNDSVGTAGNVITITNNPGDTVVFDGLTTETYWIWFEATVASYPGHYIVIDGTNKNIRFTRFRGAAPAFRGDGASAYMHHMALLNTQMDHTHPALGAGTQTLYAHHIIMKGNLISDTSTGGPPESTADHGLYSAEGSQNVVVMQNTFQKIGGFGLHFYGHNIYTVLSNNNIIRNNIVNNTHNGCFLFTGALHKDNYVYNNTCYNDAIPRADMDGNPSQSSFSIHLSKNWDGMRILNNISNGYFSSAAIDAATYSQLTTNLTLNYNMYGNAVNANNLIRWDADTTTTTKYNLAGFQAATIYEDNGLSSNPLFVSVSTGNFTLGAGSPAIDAGRDLTTAVGAGSSSTSLTVADAGFFFDGFGLMTGDSIKIGAAALVTVTNVNYTTNVITLSAARSWSNGDKVNLTFNGARPDMGALEAPGSALVFTSQPVSTQIGTTLANVVVTNQDGSGATITGFVGNVVLEKNTGPGTLGGTLTKAAVAGVATFNDLSVDTVGTYTLVATTPSATSATSVAFDGTAIPVVPVSGVIPMKITRIR